MQMFLALLLPPWWTSWTCRCKTFHFFIPLSRATLVFPYPVTSMQSPEWWTIILVSDWTPRSHWNSITKGRNTRTNQSKSIGTSFDDFLQKVSLVTYQIHYCRSRSKLYMWYGMLGTKELMQRTYKKLEQVSLNHDPWWWYSPSLKFLTKGSPSGVWWTSNSIAVPSRNCCSQHS